MIEEHVLEQLGEFGVGIDALAIVELREQLDIQRQCQHRPCTLAEHGMGDGVGVDVEAIAVGQNVAEHRLDAAEQRLVLQLLVAEPDQRLERDLVAEPVIVAQFKDLGVDEALDQPKDIGVGAALDLAHEPLFIGRQGGERHRPGKARPEGTCGWHRSGAPGLRPHRGPSAPALTPECSAHTGSLSEILLIAFIFVSFSGAVRRRVDEPVGYAAIGRSAGGRGSMTGPPGDMTETPDPDRNADMDALSDVLRVAHLTGGVFLHADFFAPWCIAARVAPEHCMPALGPASHLIIYHYVIEGEFRIRRRG